MENQQRAFLLILDGWGLGKKPSADAILQANTPFFDGLMQKYVSMRRFHNVRKRRICRPLIEQEILIDR